MANLGMTFDPDQAPQDEFEDLPANTYPMQIIGSEVKPTQSGDGEGLNFQFEVIDGEFQGRQYWEWLNIKHANPKAEEIAHATLGKICKAANVGPIADSEELHHIPMLVTLKPKKNKQTGDVQIRATTFAPYQSAPQGHQAPQRNYQHQPANNGNYQQSANNGGAAMPTNGGQRRWGNRQANA